MAGKKKKQPITAEYYIITPSSYSSNYDYSLGSDLREGPYSQYLSITIKGVLRITTSKKVKPNVSAEIYILSKTLKPETDDDFIPKCIAQLSFREGALYCCVILPVEGVHYVLSMLNSGKVEAVVLFGNEMLRNKADIRSFEISTVFEWKDWEEEPTENPVLSQ